MYRNNVDNYLIIKKLKRKTGRELFESYVNDSDDTFMLERINLENRNINIDDLYKTINDMKQCDNENIIKLYSSFTNENYLYICYPKMELSLSNILKKNIQIDEINICNIIKNILNGLEYMHNYNIIHKNIKASNIFYDKNNNIKLGIIKIKTDNNYYRSSKGLLCWTAPEVIMDGKYKKKSDIWSIGILCLELAKGIPPYYNLPPIKTAKSIVMDDPPNLYSYGNIYDEHTNEFNDFINYCLIKDYNKRPSIHDLKNTKFIKKKLKLN